MDQYLLKVEDLETGYGKKQIINGVNLTISQGEIVSLIGHNGAGKSTILKTIFGLTTAWKGKVIYEGKEIQNRTPVGNIRDGIVFVPQGNRVFTELTVSENLEMAGYALSNKTIYRERVATVTELFPVLSKKGRQLAGTLSGGEKQMLALSSGLMLSPRLLLLDEPSLGLSPAYINATFRKITEINKRFGTSVLIVEQKVREVLRISTKTYVLKVGKISFEGLSTELLQDDKIRKNYL
jgi:branched-chain amino acid transport system ATP-binding protein